MLLLLLFSELLDPLPFCGDVELGDLNVPRSGIGGDVRCKWGGMLACRKRGCGDVKPSGRWCEPRVASGPEGDEPGSLGSCGGSGGGGNGGVDPPGVDGGGCG